jgi:hypothetical protein
MPCCVTSQALMKSQTCKCDNVLPGQSHREGGDRRMWNNAGMIICRLKLKQLIEIAANWSTKDTTRSHWGHNPTLRGQNINYHYHYYYCSSSNSRSSTGITRSLYALCAKINHKLGKQVANISLPLTCTFPVIGLTFAQVHKR